MARIQEQTDIHDAVKYFIPFVIECVFFGVYSMLFFLCIYILSLKREDMLKRRQDWGFMIFLYGLAMIHMALTCILAFEFEHVELQYLSFAAPMANVVETSTASETPASRMAANLCIGLKVLFFLSNLLAGVVFINRCYIIWGMRKRVIVFPCFGMFCTIASFLLQSFFNGILAQAGLIAFIASTVMTNLVTVGLIAGRIWWISREAKAFLGKSARNGYSIATAILLESGILYPLIFIVAVVTFFFGFASLVFVGMLYQVVGIAPTLIIVRVGMGVAHDDVISLVDALRVGHDEHPEWRNGHSMDVQPEMPDSYRLLGAQQSAV
ncbi:hypothetical protein C8J56DRAFT_978622 [Mycena floridula]|nr:hypothetical protein C8J56DRAFT_978622 [Mycena floridula]